jgi:hypothetical protein
MAEKKLKAEGIVEEAATFRGVCVPEFKIFFINNVNEPIPNLKCKIRFEDGREITGESDGSGKIIFLKHKKEITLSLVDT